MDQERAFGGFAVGDEPIPRPSQGNGQGEGRRTQQLRSLSSQVVGRHEIFSTPYGSKAVVYADWTASGRLLRGVEGYLVREVMPFYGNTHTATSITGHQTTCYRHEARQIVAQAVNAKVTGKAAEDVVLFVGNGTTAAVQKLVLSLGLHIPLGLHSGGEEEVARPVVFTSSYEHHSNLLAWRESVAEVVTVKYSQQTGVCLEDLERLLIKYSGRKALKIGSFSAASNVTGILTAVDEVSALLHTHGALAFYDYATAAPYAHIDMNPALNSLAYKDAIFFSGHKFLGGPGAPGVLIAKRKVLAPQSDTPSVPGGGTVFYVTEEHHRYLSNREEREEGGTPQIMGDVKLGLVMNLKIAVGSAWIHAEELRISSYAQERLAAHSDLIVLLGRPTAENHLPIFSFLIRAGARFLHHNFVCALLNDLFGVQTRGGCQCAGPFSQRLLGLSSHDNARIEASLLEKHEVLRPGYSRLSLPYWISHREMEFVLDAVIFVAQHGFRFLPAYRYNHRTGEWAHTSRLTRFPERRWLSHFDITSSSSSSSSSASEAAAIAAQNGGGVGNDDDKSDDELYERIFMDAVNELEKTKGGSKGGAATAGGSGGDGAELGAAWADLRWFALSTDDLSASNLALVGPVQPSATGHHFSSSSSSSAPAVAELTNAYGSHRAVKLAAHAHNAAGGGGGHDSNSRPTPRHVQLAADQPLPVQVSASAVASSTASSSSSSASSSSSSAAAAASAAVASLPRGDKSCLLGTCSTAPVPAAPVAATNGKKPAVVAPPKKIMKLVGQCVREWSMIEDGDRLCLGLSGGKDSLSLLHVLLALQKRAPIRFTIACATVDPQTASFDPSPLIPYVQSLGVTYHYLSQPIVEMATSRLQGDSLCAFCARFKRGLLYSCCRDNGYNKLVLAQHLDDFAESFLMSALHNGQMRTMKANYSIDAGDLEVIRPFAYVREHQTRQFALEAKLPIINENCPACFEQPKERARVKQLLAQEESMVPALFFNLRRALLPLMGNETYTAMATVAEQIAARGQMRSNATREEKAPAGAGAGAGAGEDEDEVEASATKRPRVECSKEGGCPIVFDEMFE